MVTMAPDTDTHARLESLAVSIKARLRETGARVLQIGQELAEAKRLSVSTKAFEAWVVGKVGISLATAYRWIQTASMFATFGLDRRPDLLDECDVADILSVSFPQAFRSRIAARLKAFTAAEQEATEAKADAEKEMKKLKKATEELTAAEKTLTEAKAKAERLTGPAQATHDAVKSKVVDIRSRVTEAQSRVASILSDARTKIEQSKAAVAQAKSKAAETQATADATQATAAEAKAAVQTEVKATVAAVQTGRKTGTPPAKVTPDIKTDAWVMFSKQVIRAAVDKAAEVFPLDVARQRLAVSSLGSAMQAAAGNIGKATKVA